MTLPLVTLPKDLPPSGIHKILAFAYARNTTSSQAQRPVSELTYEGLVLALIDDCPTEHLEKTVVIDRIRAELGVNQDVASEILELAITNLVNSKEISIVGRYLRKSLHYQPFLDDALARLSRGVIDRVKVTSGISLEASKIDSIPRIIEQLFITRAWDIAAQYAGSTISEGGHTEETIEVLVKQHLGENFTHVSSIVEGLSSLLQNPDDSEARMLAEIGRTAFSVQMLIGSPRSFVHHRHTLPAKIYFDASILLPALVVGHPLREGYYNAIKRLRDAAALSGLSMEVIVADVFLEEILRHREKALQEFRELGLAEVADFKRYIAFYGADRVNVFIGAYAAFINGHTGALNFSDFLASEAPYTNHEELVHYLEKLRFKVKVLDFTQKNAVEYTTVFNGLLEGYEAIARLQSVTYNKPRVLIQHEAAQLTQLFIDLQHKQRPLFVTADNRLQRSIARSPALAPLAGSVLSAIGFYGLIDFMVGLLPDKEIYARLIWASPRTDAARQIRDYLEWRKLKAVGRSLDALNLVKFS